MKRILIALMTVLALLSLGLMSPAAVAGPKPTVPYVKQDTIRLRTTGLEATKLVTLVNPTPEMVGVMFDFLASELSGDATVGTCGDIAVPANSSCTLGVVFRPDYGSPSFTLESSVTITFRAYSTGDTVSTDTFNVIAKYVAP